MFFYVVVYEGYVSFVELLIGCGVDVNLVDKRGWMFLYFVVVGG